MAHTEIIRQIFSINDYGLWFAFARFRFLCVFRQLCGHYTFAANFGDFPVQRPYACFTGVIAHDVAHGVFLNPYFAFAHTVSLHLLGNQILHGDTDFFIFCVARQPNDFHTVEQGRRNIHAV